MNGWSNYNQQQINQRAAEEQRRIEADRAQLEAEAAERKRRNDEMGQSIRAQAEQERAAKAAAADARENARREQAETELKDQAWRSYPGTLASFQQDWPAIRARLMAEQVDQQREAARREHARLYNW